MGVGMRTGNSRKKAMRFAISIVHQQEGGYVLRVGNDHVCDDILLDDVTAIANAFRGTINARTTDEAVSLLRVWILRQIVRVAIEREKSQNVTVDWKREGF